MCTTKRQSQAALDRHLRARFGNCWCALLRTTLRQEPGCLGQALEGYSLGQLLVCTTKSYLEAEPGCLRQALDGYIEDQPLVPARVRGGGHLSREATLHQQLAAMIDPGLHVQHLRLRPPHVVQANHADSELSGDVPHGHGEDLRVLFGERREVAMGTCLARRIVYKIPLYKEIGVWSRCDKAITNIHSFSVQSRTFSLMAATTIMDFQANKTPTNDSAYLFTILNPHDPGCSLYRGPKVLLMGVWSHRYLNGVCGHKRGM